MEEGSLLPAASSLSTLSFATVFIIVLCNFARQNKESVLRRLGILLGKTPTTFVQDGAVAMDTLVRRADEFSNRAGGPSAILSGGRHPNITAVPYGPRWVALRRNITSEALHPIRGLARAGPHREREAAALVADIAARSAGGGVVVPVRECLYAALFAMNAATCFGDGVLVDREHMDAMRVAQQEFLSMIPALRVFGNFSKVTRLLYRDRWKQVVHCRRRQELYIPLIRACQERRRTGAGTATSLSYVDTLLDLEIPVEGDDGSCGRRRWKKLSDGDMVSLVTEYLGASTGAIAAALEWTMANLVMRPDIQSRLCGEVEAAKGEACAYMRAVVMESLRQHPPVPVVRRHMSSDTLVGGSPLAGGTMVIFPLEGISNDDKIWTSPDQFIPERFMPGGEGAGVRLVSGNKEATKVKMMPFGAGRRICPGMDYGIQNLEYFVEKLVMAFEWHPVKQGEKVDLTAERGFFTTMKHPLRARVVPRAPAPVQAKV